MKNTIFIPLALLVLGFEGKAQRTFQQTEDSLRCPVTDIAAGGGFVFIATPCGFFRMRPGDPVWQKSGFLPPGGVDFIAANGPNVVAVQRSEPPPPGSPPGRESLRFFKSGDSGEHFFLKTEVLLNTARPPLQAGELWERNETARLFQISDSTLFLAGTHTVADTAPVFSNFAGCISPDGGETWHWQALPNAGTRAVGDFPGICGWGDSLAVFTHDRFYVTGDLGRIPGVFSEPKFSPALLQTGMARFGKGLVVAFSDGSLAATGDGTAWATERPDIGGINDLIFNEGEIFCCTSRGFFRGRPAGRWFQFSPVGRLPEPFRAVRKAAPLAGGDWLLLSEGQALFLKAKSGEARIAWGKRKD